MKHEILSPKKNNWAEGRDKSLSPFHNRFPVIIHVTDPNPEIFSCNDMT